MKFCTSATTIDQPTSSSLVIEMVPKEGTLKPYEEREVFFKFSPRFSQPRKGWSKEVKLAPRRDYAMFLHIKAVGTVTKQNEGIMFFFYSIVLKLYIYQTPYLTIILVCFLCIVGDLYYFVILDLNIELALTGTALPVAVSILPTCALQFGECPIGESISGVLQIRNDSGDIPLCFAVQRIAHFLSSPACAFVDPDDIMNLTLYFQPKQNGTFKNNLLLDIIGQTCMIDDTRKPIYKKVVLETHKILVTGSSPLTTGTKIKENTSILTSQNDKVFLQMLTSKQTAFESNDNSYIKMKTSSSELIRIAHPNERACSIRPSDSNDFVR